MVMIPDLWLPILLSAVIVWLASALVWMVLPHHKNEWRGFPNEDGMRQALRAQDARPGYYAVPHAGGGQAMRDPAFREKMQEGPIAHVTLMPAGPAALSMGRPMVLLFVYFLVAGVAVAYVAGRTLSPGTEYLPVFRVVGTTAWLAYGFGIVPESIWFGRPWSSTLKHLADAFAYGLLTAGVFGWLWP